MHRRRIIPFWIVSILFLFLSITPILFAELINDGSFENQPSDWEEYYNTSCNAISIGNWVPFGGPLPVDGQQTFWAGGACANGIIANNGARQEITLQPDAALLSFWYNPIKAPDPQNDDLAIVSFDTTPIWTLNVDGITSPTGWNNALVDITQFSNQTGTLSLEMQHDNDLDVAHVFFDYIEVFHPSIQISQVISPEAVSENEAFTVESTVVNSGDTVLNNISVTNTSFASCDRTAGDLPDLNPGESSSYICEVTNATLDMENTATVLATTTEIEYVVEANHTVSSFVINPLLELVVEPDEVTIVEGEQVTFALTITNRGDGEFTNVQISSPQATGCTLFLDALAVQETAVFNCSYTPLASGLITFIATAVEPKTNTEMVVETAVSIELLPNVPPTEFRFSLFLPLTANNFLNHNAFGEPNDICDHAFPITPNQSAQFLAEDIHDWYEFSLGTTSDINVDLTNFVPIAGQITLWRGGCQNLTFIGQNGDFSAEKNISLTNQPPGTYYVWIINDGPINNTNKYSLLVSTP